MAVRKESSLLLTGGLLLTALVGTGCRGTPQPVARAEQTPPPAATPAPQPSSTPAPPLKEPTRDDAPVVVDPGDDESSSPRTLVQAARAERERRAKAGSPIAVITDKNIHQYAAKGQLTVADPKEKKKGTAVPVSTPAEAEKPAHDEQYWRGHALEIRLRWRAAFDEVARLEQRSTELRQRFYSENDSYVRDNQVKPEWDRVTDRLRQARAETESAKEELAAFLEEGRRANALPGWLREGEDQEPPAAPEKKKDGNPDSQSIEPPVLKDNGGHGPWS
ncbi:MAG TPA: hypothetical protein VF173_17820 [Thermoanaerobaculia bacterium]|nr:hypothetical protein [Thermoanaerobaculia bacterium]